VRETAHPAPALPDLRDPRNLRDLCDACDLPDLRDLRIAFLWQMPPLLLRRLAEQAHASALPFPCTPEDVARLVPELAHRLAADLAGIPDDESLERIAAAMARDRVRLLREGAAGWPARVSEMVDPPPLLFLQGDPLDAPASRCVGIVGSRAASATGREISYTLGRDLALAGVTVVSGMARGIDGEAHVGALDAGGRTVAVLGTGSDIAYPSEHGALMRRILNRGGTVTEFPPGTPPRPLHFPRRNRILAALCDVVIIVEGSERSGARSTADFALDQGRELMAVPRDICLPGSVLPNRLLRDGAAPVLGAASVLAALEAMPRVSARAEAREGEVAGARGCAGGRVDGLIGQGAPAPGASGHSGNPGNPGEITDARVLAMLRNGVRDLDRMIRDLGASEPGRVQAVLARLELLGRVERRPGGRYALSGTGSGRPRGAARG
jgi:DNA processing protein